MISLHLIPDCDTQITWDVVQNNETETPVGRVKVYAQGNVGFISDVPEIDMRVLCLIGKAFYHQSHE
jgi:hypothetical protein